MRIWQGPCPSGKGHANLARTMSVWQGPCTSGKGYDRPARDMPIWHGPCTSGKGHARLARVMTAWQGPCLFGKGHIHLTRAMHALLHAIAPDAAGHRIRRRFFSISISTSTSVTLILCARRRLDLSVSALLSVTFLVLSLDCGTLVSFLHIVVNLCAQFPARNSTENVLNCPYTSPQFLLCTTNIRLIHVRRQSHSTDPCTSSVTDL